MRLGMNRCCWCGGEDCFGCGGLSTPLEISADITGADWLAPEYSTCSIPTCVTNQWPGYNGALRQVEAHHFFWSRPLSNINGGVTLARHADSPECRWFWFDFKTLWGKTSWGRSVQCPIGSPTPCAGLYDVQGPYAADVTLAADGLNWEVDAPPVSDYTCGGANSCASLIPSISLPHGLGRTTINCGWTYYGSRLELFAGTMWTQSGVYSFVPVTGWTEGKFWNLRLHANWARAGYCVGEAVDCETWSPVSNSLGQTDVPRRPGEISDVPVPGTFPLADTDGTSCPPYQGGPLGLSIHDFLPRGLWSAEWVAEINCGADFSGPVTLTKTALWLDRQTFAEMTLPTTVEITVL